MREILFYFIFLVCVWIWTIVMITRPTPCLKGQSEPLCWLSTWIQKHEFFATIFVRMPRSSRIYMWQQDNKVTFELSSSFIAGLASPKRRTLLNWPGYKKSTSVDQFWKIRIGHWFIAHPEYHQDQCPVRFLGHNRSRSQCFQAQPVTC